MRKLFVIFAFATALVCPVMGQHTITIVPDATATGKLVFRELNANGANYVSLQAKPALVGNVTFKLPATPGIPGDCLMNGAVAGEWTMSTCGAGGLPVSDAIPFVHPAADATALMRFNATAIAPATTVVLAIPNTSMILAGSDVDNAFTATQTFNAVMSSLDNGWNVGTSAARFATFYGYAGDFGGPDTIIPGLYTNSVTARKFIVKDTAGSSAFNYIAGQTSNGASYMQFMDTSSVAMLELSRVFLSSPTNLAIFDVSPVPKAASRTLGTLAIPWVDAYVTNMHCTGTGCAIDLLPLNNSWTGTNTFHALMSSLDNGWNVGTAGTRFATFYGYGGDFGGPDTIIPGLYTNPVIARKFIVKDSAGSSSFNYIAGQTSNGAQYMQFMDPSSNAMLELSRVFSFSSTNLAIFDVSPVPKAASRTLGTAAIPWVDAYVTNFHCTGTGCGGAPFIDTNPLIKGSVDATKLMRFEVDGFTTATTRVLTPQNADYTLAGIDLAQTFTLAQTFHDALCFSNNGCNIGTDPARFNTLYAYNIDAAPAAGIGNYVKTRQLAVVDRNGGNAYWDMLSTAVTGLNSDFTIRDNAGAAVLKFSRFFGGTPDNSSVFYTDVYPNTGGTTKLGTTAKRWDAYVQNIDIAGTCTGCLAGVLTANNFWTGTNQFYNNLFEIEADGGNSSFIFSSVYGTGFNGFIGRAAGGSVAFPSATVSGQQLASLGGRGKTGGGAWTAGNSATIAFVANENWAGGGNGSYAIIATTPNGSTARTNKLFVNGLVDYQTIQTPGGVYANLGMTVDQAFYPRALGACSSLNGSNSTYGGLGYQAGSVYCYWNASTLAWNTVDFGAGAVSLSGTNVWTGNNQFNNGISVNGPIYPITTNSYALGFASARWSILYTQDLNVSGVSTVAGFSSLSSINLRDPANTFNRVLISSSGSGGVVSANDGSGTMQSQLNGLSGVVTGKGGFVGPSGVAGVSFTYSCAAFQAIKSITVSGGIVTNATCGTP